MIDTLETVIQYLKSDADLNLLTGGRVAALHKFGDGWPIPSKAVRVRYDGGTPDLDVQAQRARLEISCFGETQLDASKVYGALVNVSRNTLRKRVQTNQGFALLYWLLPLSGPSFLQDVDAGVDLTLVFFEAHVSELDLGG